MLRMFMRVIFTLVILTGITAVSTFAQKKKSGEEKKSVVQNAYREGLRLITTNPGDTIQSEESTERFEPYSGYIIRNIYSQRINFEYSIYDSAKKINKTLLTVANALHGNTKEKIIYNHLFIKANEPLIPGKVSDNERFLRDLNFILDSRIIPLPVECTDSVDLIVVTRDIFSLGFNSGGASDLNPFGAGSASGPKLSIFDANVNGRGQLIEYTAMINPDRSPNIGHALRYRKSSFLATKGNLEFGYTQINTGRSFGDENEYAVYTRYFRPLVSPYTRLAGGFEISRNWSENVYGRPDSEFLKYEYSIYDFWLGINIGIHRAITNRNRTFLAYRFFDGNYQDQPEQPEFLAERKYNNMTGALSELTFYRQDYFKTRFVYGFGRTEDVPYGYSLGFTVGYVQELNDFNRPYAGIRYSYSFASQKTNFYDVTLQIGSYFNDKTSSFEDITLLAHLNYFSQVLNLNRYKIRGFLSAQFATIKRQQTLEWITINPRIIPGFTPEDFFTQRTMINVGGSLFTPWSLIGFRIAPIVTMDVVNAECLNCNTNKQTFFGFTGGMRIRNENLIFGTIEMKLSVIPRNAEGDTEFVFRFSQNLRIKKTSSFVRPPTILNINQ